MNESVSSLYIYCLCAAWCGTCRGYEQTFNKVLQQLQESRIDGNIYTAWVDVEDHEIVLDILDVETFPTIVLVLDEQPIFLGAITPHETTLLRLLQQVQRMQEGRHERAALVPLGQSLQSMTQLLRYLQPFGKLMNS